MPILEAYQLRAARAREHKASSALQKDAGQFAPFVARVFPRPHAQYFQADEPRRRAMQIIAARANTTAEELYEPLQFWSLKRLFDAFAPEAPRGASEMLRKLRGPGWHVSDYDRLFAVLGDGGHGAKLLQHAREIEKALLGVLFAVPEPLRRPRIVAQLPDAHLAELAARTAKRVCAPSDARAVNRLADRLERARSSHGLFSMLIEEVGLEKLAPPPVPGSEWLKPLATVEAIRSAALRFQNCLAGRIGWLLKGFGAYYEVVGDEPAIVEIVRDNLGLWVVGEVRGHANAPITKPLALRIISYLEMHGAHLRGRKSADVLALQLADAAGL